VFRRVILAILVVLAVIALVGAIGAGFHHAGYWGPGGHMMRYGPGFAGYGVGWGFFPGLFLFPLFLLLILGAVFWRPWHHHSWRYGYGPGPWGSGPHGPGGPSGPGAYGQGGPRQMFEEWHRQAHGGDPNAPGGSGAPGATPPSGGAASPPPGEPPTPPQAPGGSESAS